MNRTAAIVTTSQLRKSLDRQDNKPRLSVPGDLNWILRRRRKDVASVVGKFGR